MAGADDTVATITASEGYGIGASPRIQNDGDPLGADRCVSRAGGVALEVINGRPNPVIQIPCGAWSGSTRCLSDRLYRDSPYSGLGVEVSTIPDGAGIGNNCEPVFCYSPRDTAGSSDTAAVDIIQRVVRWVSHLIQPMRWAVSWETRRRWSASGGSVPCAKITISRVPRLVELGTYARVDNTAYRPLRHATPTPSLLYWRQRVMCRNGWCSLNARRLAPGCRHPIPQALLQALGEPLMRATLALPGMNIP